MRHNTPRIGSHLLSFGAALIVGALLVWAAPLIAQDVDDDAPLGEMELVVLTDDQMQRYLNALPEIVVHKNDPAADISSVAYWEEMVAIAARHGFTDYADFTYMAATLATLLMGIDPETQKFIEPRARLEEDITYLTDLIEEAKAELDFEAGREPSDAYPPELLPLVFMLDELKAGRTLLPEKTDLQNIKMIEKYFPQIARLSSPAYDPEGSTQ